MPSVSVNITWARLKVLDLDFGQNLLTWKASQQAFHAPSADCSTILEPTAFAAQEVLLRISCSASASWHCGTSISVVFEDDFKFSQFIHYSPTHIEYCWIILAWGSTDIFCMTCIQLSMTQIACSEKNAVTAVCSKCEAWY